MPCDWRLEESGTLRCCDLRELLRVRVRVMVRVRVRVGVRVRVRVRVPLQQC